MTSLALDRDVYARSDSLTARFGVRKITDEPVALSFFTSQIYDLEIRDANGNVVFLWSRGQTFAQIVSEIEIDDEKDYVITAALIKLRPGKYVAQAWFTADGPPRAYSASARFQVAS
jgi:hypothetical protein